MQYYQPAAVRRLAAAIRVWQVFPIDFSSCTFPWEPLTRLLMALAIFGSFVAIVIEVVRLASLGISAGLRSHSH